MEAHVTTHFSTSNSIIYTRLTFLLLSLVMRNSTAKLNFSEEVYDIAFKGIKIVFMVYLKAHLFLINLKEC